MDLEHSKSHILHRQTLEKVCLIFGTTSLGVLVTIDLIHEHFKFKFFLAIFDAFFRKEFRLFSMSLKLRDFSNESISGSLHGFLD